jgi:hypothetical protein
MDLLVESVFAIDEENVEVLLREQASTLKSGKSGANDRHIVGAGRHVRILRSSRSAVKYFTGQRHPGILLSTRIEERLCSRNS